MAAEQSPGAESSPGETPDAVAAEQSPGAEDAAAGHRSLHRSDTDKVIAGVAGGIGAYFGIDAVIVRIAFIVLTFLGGAGPFLYLIGWLALPREESGSVVANALGGDSPHRFHSLVAVALIGLGLLVTANLSGELFEAFINVWTIAPYLSLILIAAGVALVLWPGPSGRSKPTPARPSAPPPPAPAAPPPSSAYAAPAPTSSSAYAAPAPTPPTAAGPEWPPASPAGPPPSPAAPVRRRGRTTLGYLTVAILLVYTGGTAMLDRLDVVEVDIGVYFAIAVAITGAGLLASALAVPARGLILLGVALCTPLLLFAGPYLPWGSGVGEVRVSVTAASELQDEYRHGVGQMVVDLRYLDPDRTDHSVELSLSVGEMLVYVPDNISTIADINVGAGNIRVWYGGPAPGRLRDLTEVRDLLEGLRNLPYGDEDLDDLESYLEAYETYSGLRIRPEQRQPLARLFVEDPGFEGTIRFRDRLELLVIEASGAGYPWEESEEGLGISRRITLPARGEHEGELRLDIDVGIGEAEVITVPATVP